MRSWPASSSATLMTSHEASLTHVRRRGPALVALARTFSMMVMLWRQCCGGHVVAVMAGQSARRGNACVIVAAARLCAVTGE